MKVSLIITAYNRPEYLDRCLHSLMCCFGISKVNIVIVDDASTDPKVMPLILQSDAMVLSQESNMGIKQAIKRGVEHVIDSSDLIINLDSDAIVKPNFITEIIKLHKDHPDSIISGFNSKNTNSDGSLRNPIIAEHENYYLKMHANGINMAFTPDQYEQFIRPALEKEGNWDFNVRHFKPFVIAKPSLVQHIGLVSSMGHNVDPDVAADFIELELPDVTLFGIDSHDPEGIKRAAEISTRSVKFGAEVIITDKLFEGREGYSKFCIESMAAYVNTSHVLIIHTDGYIQNPGAWKDEWLQYDYIGATWWYKDGKNNGNGGFSLRSKKLLDILATLDLEEYHPEDHVICRNLRKWLEATHGIKFAPDEVCNQFSIEAYNVPAPDNVYSGQFGFHGYYVEGLPFPIKSRRTTSNSGYRLPIATINAINKGKIKRWK